MVQNVSWEWLLEGFKIELDTQVKRKTIKDYCDHLSYFARWAQDHNKKDPRFITKRDIQEFLHFVASTPATFITGYGARRQIQRNENSRWHHYFPLKRFFAWAANEGYLEQNPIDGIVLKRPIATPIEPYRREHIDAFVKVLDYDWQVARTPRQKMLAAVCAVSIAGAIGHVTSRKNLVSFILLEQLLKNFSKLLPLPLSSVVSRLGRGSTFFFTMPLSQSSG